MKNVPNIESSVKAGPQVSAIKALHKPGCVIENTAYRVRAMKQIITESIVVHASQAHTAAEKALVHTPAAALTTLSSNSSGPSWTNNQWLQQWPTTPAWLALDPLIC